MSLDLITPTLRAYWDRINAAQAAADRIAFAAGNPFGAARVYLEPNDAEARDLAAYVADGRARYRAEHTA